MPLLLAGLPVHLALGMVSALLAVLSSALLLWRRSFSPSKLGGTAATGTTPKKTSLQAGKANGSTKQIVDPSLADPSKPCCRILYGTQTGTAERFAKQLGKELNQKYGDSVIIDVLDIENYRAAERLPNERLVVLCMATYGDGEPTDNAADFYSWLVKEGAAVTDGEKEPYLQAVQYAVFGLGNKQYEHFNKMGRQCHKLLAQLGAKALLRAGEGDDDCSIDEDFDKWCLEFHEALVAKPALLGVQASANGTTEPLATVAAYEVTVAPPGSDAAPAFPPGSGLEAHHPLTARVALVRELHLPGSDRACVHAEIDISGSALQYAHGDHLAIHAQNAPEVVQEVAAMLGTDLDAVITLRKPQATAATAAVLADPPCRGPVTLRSLLAYHSDVLDSPHKDALLALAAAATDPSEAARLMHLASPAGKDEYAAYIGRTRRSLLEVMRDFPSARPSLGAFFGSVAPRLQPRFYSISSSPALHPQTVHVTCAVVKEVTPTGRTHHGIASSWLQRCGEAGGSASVPVFVRRSHFKLPADAMTPIVMVGPGTGLAPFRGFLQERAALQKSGTKLGPAVLFFGCRTSAHDFIYQQELETYLRDGVLTALHAAFSRDGPKKVYVQHHMERESEALWGLLSAGAHMYVCGDAKAMARDVNRALVAVVQKGRGCSGTQAEAWVKELSDSGKYQRDVW